MKLLAPTAQQRPIRGILDEGVFEDKRRLARAAAAEDQSSLDQLVQLITQLIVRAVRDRLHRVVGELTADSRANLRHLLDRAEPIQAGHQRIMQARRDRQRW